MIKFQPNILAFLVLIGPQLLCPKLYALDCMPVPLDKNIIDQADAIFQGKAGKGKELTEKELLKILGIDPSQRLGKYVVYPFRINQSWKGVSNNEEILLLRNIYWGDEFLKDESYFVLTNEKRGEFFMVPECGYTTKLKLAVEKGTIKMVEETMSQREGSSYRMVQPVEIEDVQLYRDGGTTGLKIRDTDDNLFMFSLDKRLTSDTKGSFFEGAMHPGDQHASITKDGGERQRDILRALLHWLNTNIEPKETRDTYDIVDSERQLKENAQSYMVVNFVNQLRQGFDAESGLQYPKYNCYDLHGGYHCWRETGEIDHDKGNGRNGLSKMFGCESDEDCYSTRQGGCATGKHFADLMKDQVAFDREGQCRCEKGPVFFGCVPVTEKYLRN